MNESLMRRLRGVFSGQGEMLSALFTRPGEVSLNRLRSYAIWIPAISLSLVFFVVEFLEYYFGLSLLHDVSLHLLGIAILTGGAYFFSDLIFKIVRQQQEAILKHSQERVAANAALQSLFDGVPVGLYRVNREGQILDVNAALVRILGFPDKQSLLAARTPSFYVDPGARAQWLAQIERDGIVRDFEVQLRRHDGQPVWARLSARTMRDPEGNVLHYEGVMQDVTERKRSEEAVRKLGSAVEQTVDAVSITDRDGVIEYINPAFEQLTGYSLEEARGKTHRILKSGKHDQAFYEKLWHTILGGQVYRGELLNKKKDGTLYYSELAITPIRDAEGEIAQFVATQRDITDRIQAQARLRESEEQLRAFAARLESVREEERARIAREIHDELGQAMTGLKFDLSWLAKHLSSANSELVDKTETMLHLVDLNIQSVRRIATELRPGILDDFGLVAAMEWQAREFEARTSITCHFTSSLPAVQLDREQSTAMFRILQEALTNVARHANATEVAITLTKGGDSLCLEVQDNGTGIAESEISGRKSLGLLGMRERAHLLGGEVAIVGTPAKGTRVTVKVPLHVFQAARP